MPLFLISFLLVFSSFHAYFFLRLQAALCLGKAARATVLLVLLAGILAPVAVRVLEMRGWWQTATVLAWMGYTWMAVVFLFATAAAVLDLTRLVLLASRRLAGWPLPVWGPGPALTVPLLLALAATTQGLVAAGHVRVERVSIRTTRLSPADGPLRVAQISDCHLGLLNRRAFLKNVITLVQAARPDLVVSTGDLVDAPMDRLPELAADLAALTPPLGKLAVTGNHEYYVGVDQALDFTRRAGFRVLQGEVVEAGPLAVAGVDDATAAAFGQQPSLPEEALLATAPASRFRLFLKHRPQVHPASLGRFDLQLSGHTHKGQIFPFSIVTWLYYPVHAGVLAPVDGCFLYVSRGTGTWGPRIRFLSPPEITIIDLVPAGLAGVAPEPSA
ncbi:MAG: metallophosphoesterase [Thermodesulfobacteriota bacterium]